MTPPLYKPNRCYCRLHGLREALSPLQFELRCLTFFCGAGGGGTYILINTLKHILSYYRIIHMELIPADTRRYINAGLTLIQRRRRWTNVKPTLIQRLLSAGMYNASIMPVYNANIFFLSYDINKLIT